MTSRWVPNVNHNIHWYQRPNHLRRNRLKRHWANLRGYVGWWYNALRVPRLQEFDGVSPKSTRSMSWIAQSHSQTKLGMGALNALCHHPTYPLGICSVLLVTYRLVVRTKINNENQEFVAIYLQMWTKIEGIQQTGWDSNPWVSVNWLSSGIRTIKLFSLLVTLFNLA